jgi:hypothetical protein
MTGNDPNPQGSDETRRLGLLPKIGAAVIGGLVFLLILAFGLPHLQRALDIDSCLDAGGRWNAEREKCEGARR